MLKGGPTFSSLYKTLFELVFSFTFLLHYLYMYVKTIDRIKFEKASVMKDKYKCFFLHFVYSFQLTYVFLFFSFLFFFFSFLLSVRTSIIDFRKKFRIYGDLKVGCFFCITKIRKLIVRIHHSFHYYKVFALITLYSHQVTLGII